MLGAGVNFVVSAHAIEGVLASAVVLGRHGFRGALTLLGDDAALLVAFAALSLAQFPLLALLRLRCAYEVPTEAPTLDDAIRGGWFEDTSRLDRTDRATPLALVFDVMQIASGGNLMLSGRGLGDAGAQVLGEVLKASATLEFLDLSGNSIGDAGARAIAEGLKASATLEWLNLRENPIGDAGARALREAKEARPRCRVYWDEGKKEEEKKGLSPRASEEQS